MIAYSFLRSLIFQCNLVVQIKNNVWQAAAEAEVATMSMTIRAIPYAPSNEEASQEMRGNWVQAIKQHHMKHSGNVTIQNIVDIGCSVGVSTRFLADEFPSAKVTVSAI